MKKLLVVVDYQNDFVSGSLGFPAAAAIEDAICEKIASSRACGDTVAFTFDTHSADYLQTQEGKKLPVTHCVKATQGWRLYGRVEQQLAGGDPCFEKPVFGSAALAEYAAREGFTEIELCGLVSNICVLSNAVLLRTALPEAEIVVDARCTACADPVLNEKALDVMEGLQVRVLHRG